MLLAVAETDGHTLLTYVARAQVGGKIAQIGSRLVDAAAGKIADEFFQAFEARFKAEQAPTEGDAAAETEDSEASGTKKSWLPWKRG